MNPKWRDYIIGLALFLLADECKLKGAYNDHKTTQYAQGACDESRKIGLKLRAIFAPKKGK